MIILGYRIYPKYSVRQALADSVDPDQTLHPPLSPALLGEIQACWSVI